MSPTSNSRPKVLHIITRMIVGGAQENTLMTALHFAQDGWDTAILCGPETGPEGSLQEEAQTEQLTLHIEPLLRRNIHPVNDLRCLFRLVRFLKKHRFDVVHTHSSKAGILGRLAAHLAGVPRILHTVHGWGFHEKQTRLTQEIFQALEKWTARYADKLITVSESDREAGIKNGIGKPNQYTLIRSAVNIEAITRPDREAQTIRNEVGIPDRVRVLGTVLRFSKQKNPLLLLEILKELQKEFPDTHLLAVGDGPLKERFEREAETEALPGTVHLTGLTRSVPDYLQVMDVYVLPSLWEGLPRSLISAMASAIPCVASDIPGNRDALDQGRGHLCDPTRLDAFVRAIRDIFNAPDNAAATGRTAARYVDQHFGQASMFSKLEALYESRPEEDEASVRPTGQEDKIALADQWRKEHAGEKFHAYYELRHKDRMERGAPPLFLDPVAKSTDQNHLTGLLEQLKELGLQPHHRCVDFGAGSLVMGIYIIQFLEQKKYLGLEPSAYFINQGRQRLGQSESLKDKEPGLSQLTGDSIAEAHAFNPDYIISTGVVQHIPPDELDESVSQLSTIAGAGSTILFTAKLADQSVRHTWQTWAYNLEDLQQTFNSHGFALEEVLPVPTPKRHTEKGIRNAWLRARPTN